MAEDKKRAMKEKRFAKKFVDEDLEMHALQEAKRLEQREVPSAQHIFQEHKHLVQHEEELKALLSPVQLADVQNIGKFVPGKGVSGIPRIDMRKVKKEK